MEVINATPYVFQPFDCSPAPEAPALSLILKGTFKLRPDQPAAALPRDAQPQVKGDEMYMDDLGRSLRYGSDLVPMKVRGEVTFTATCHTPDGRPRAACDVSVAVGPIQKALRVTGDRVWTRDAHGQVAPGRAQPFTSLSLRWERAFGGLSYAENPLGRGAEPAPDDAGNLVHALPNVEYADRRVADLKDRPPPAGLGPIAPTWEPRLRRQGTRDQRWAMFRAPLPPKDFDPRSYNAAPDDQQLAEGFFRGDEAIAATGLHPTLPVYRAALPGKRIRLFLLARKPGAQGPIDPARFVEVMLNLDTIHVDMDAEELTLVWRRPVKTKHRAHPEIEAAYIAEEDLADEPASREVHLRRFEELRGPKDPPVNAVLQADIDAQTAEAKKILRDAKIDPKVLEKIEGTKDPQEIFRALMDYAQKQIGEIDKMAAGFRPPG